ncbi:transcriptional regulator [Pantoea sp. BIGb0393]|uniref:Biofilm development regulator YmgB/AriR family protein n=1 Tax=Pantoea nemavictus TaxID=2726955 RepID=A0ABU8PZM0_9GAMM|nr:MULTISPECIES: biofilm development regulator YmgB/AriR family protein [Pantoea]EJL93760.1 Biofilm development protein YmgB/AriR [Pantoea sp. GM01]KNC05642.1 regulatory protein AriR [Pantoea sp. RIT-PI-b]MBA0038939.1 transcriptional regulator [Pantoea nemavictus]
MHQSTQQSSVEANIIHHFRSAGDQFSAEAAVMDAAIRDIMNHGENLTSSAMILHLIAAIENTSDEAQLDVLINALKVVVGYTPGEEERWAYFDW